MRYTITWMQAMRRRVERMKAQLRNSTKSIDQIEKELKGDMFEEPEVHTMLSCMHVWHESEVS